MAEQRKKVSTVSQVAFVVSLPGYQIKDVLGKGGMAVVYLAIQQSVGREVALKILAPDHTDDDFSERFLREARIISNMTHPNIITVFDAGIHQGCHYMSMEYVPGNSLRQARDKLSRKQKVDVIKQVAMALEYAGKKGYVHRDIKPENILLHEDGRAVLTDFGIARNQNATQGLTVTGKVFGTPYYMSPEQTKGIKVDHRSDIYSLGIVLFQVLAGYLPFDGPSLVAIGIKHLSEPTPALPQGLEIFQPIVNKCMAKKPDDRYQSAQELYLALNDISDAEIDYIDARAAAAKKLGQDYTAVTVAEDKGVAIAPDQIKRSQADRPAAKPSVQKKPVAKQQTLHTDLDDFDDRFIIDTVEFKRLKRRKRLLWLFLLAAIAAGGYYRQDDVKMVWDEQVKPVVQPYYEKIVAELGLSDKQSGSKQQTQDANKPAVVTQQKPTDADVNGAAVATDNTKPTLTIEADNVVELTSAFKQKLSLNPADQKAGNGLKQIAAWYVSQTGLALEQNDLKSARSTIERAKQGLPGEFVPAQLLALENRLLKSEAISKHLDNAKIYLEEGAIVVPIGKNALDELQAAIALDPNQPQAVNMLDKIANDLYRAAQEKMRVENLAEALNYCEFGLRAQPAHAGLLKLKQNIQQEVKIQNQILSLITRADAEFQAGKVIEPQGQSAVDLYKRVLQLKPKNAQALNGMRKSEDYLVKQISGLVWQKRFKLSEKTLNSALLHFPDSQRLQQAGRRMQSVVEKNAPRVTYVLISDYPISSMLKDQEAVKTSPSIYIGFSYTNLSQETTLLDFKLDSLSERLNLVNKKLIVSEKSGQHIFAVKHPLATFLPGQYRLSISLKGATLLTHEFTIQEPDTQAVIKVR